MAPQIRLAIELPKFDTGRYEGFEFRMVDGSAELTVRVTGLVPFRIIFDRVRWHLFTAMYNCSPDQVRSYFRLDEVVASPSLAAYIAADLASRKAYKELHHFRIYLDESGCHEVYAESCRAL